MINFVQNGDSLEYTAGADISSGNVVVIGERIGVAVTDIANGATGTVNLKGCYELTAEDDAAFTQDMALYWDTDADELTATPNANTVWAGRCHITKAEAGTTSVVRLSDSPKMIAEATTLTGTLTGTANGSLVDIAATAAACAGGATPSAAQVDTAIALAVSTIVTGANESFKELQTAHNDLVAKLKASGLMHD